MSNSYPFKRLEGRLAEASLKISKFEVAGVTVDILVRQKKGSQDFSFHLCCQVVIDSKLLDQAINNTVKIAAIKIQQQNA